MLSASRSVLDRRVLGALELVDSATGERITTPMKFGPPSLGLVRNRSGLHVINRLSPATPQQEQLAAHLNAFDAAPGGLADGAVSFDLTITDPTGRYIPRILTVALPRGADTATPITVPMAPASSAPVGQNWSGIRATLRQQLPGGDAPLAGARVTLKRDSDSAVLGTGYSDKRGEVLALAVGIPVIDFTADPGPDPAIVGTKKVTTRIEIETGPGQAWPPNPEAITSSGQAWEPVAGTLPKPELETGRIVSAGLSFLLQPQP